MQTGILAKAQCSSGALLTRWAGRTQVSGLVSPNPRLDWRLAYFGLPFLRASFLSWLSPQILLPPSSEKGVKMFLSWRNVLFGNTCHPVPQTQHADFIWVSIPPLESSRPCREADHMIPGTGLGRPKVSLLPHHHDWSRDDLIRVSQNKDTFSKGFWRKWLHSSFETTQRIFFFFFWIWTRKSLTLKAT